MMKMSICKQFWTWAMVSTLVLASATMAGAGDIRVGVSWNEKDTLVQSWEDFFKLEGESQGAKAGVNFTWLINVADKDPARQAANIEDLINQDVDIIVSRAEDGAAIGASVRSADQAGVPFITFDRASTTAQPSAHVGADSYAHAKSAGDELVAQLTASGSTAKCIELLGAQTDNNAVLFSKGWNDATKDSAVVENLVQVPTEWNPELFRSGTVNAFSSHPEANCVFVASDFAISSVQSALEQIGRWHPAGHADHVYLASVGMLPGAVTALRSGHLDAAALWDSWGHAKELVRVVVAIAAKEDPACGKDGCLAGGRVGTPANVDTMENVWSRDAE